MKIKYTLTDSDIDKSLSLVKDLKDLGVIMDPDNQILGIEETEIVIDGITPSAELSEILLGHPGFSVQYDPNELEAFKPEEGISDLDKVGSVQSPIYHDLEDIELFDEDNLTKELNSFNNKMKLKRNFNEPALDENGVAVEMKEPAVDAKQAKESAEYDPAAGSLSSFDVTPFTEEEIEQANDVTVELNGSEETKVFNEEPEEVIAEEEAIETFSDEEIKEMDSVEEVEAATEDLEEQVETFSSRKKRLYSAKLKLRRMSKKAKSLKTFAEELSEGETKEVIEDIVAILEDAPEIKEEVMVALGETTELQDEQVDTEVREDVDVASDEVEEIVETTEEPETEVEEVEEVAAFTEEEIETADEKTEESDDDDDDDEEEEEEEKCEECEMKEEEKESDETEAGEIFCKSFSSNSVLEYRRNFLANMQSKSNKR